MKPSTTRLSLIGPSGDREIWFVTVKPLPAKHYGHTDWVQREIVINSRLTNHHTIAMTLLHEIVHVTAGQNGSEELAVNLENNYSHVVAAMRNVL
jgi:hypothetical protein